MEMKKNSSCGLDIARGEDTEDKWSVYLFASQCDKEPKQERTRLPAGLPRKQTNRVESGWSLEQELHLALPFGCQRLNYLGHFF